jgi:hypothetical protein
MESPSAKRLPHAGGPPARIMPAPFSSPSARLWRRHLLLCSLVAALASAVFMLANVPLSHPLQCRETADTFGTALLLQGKNPFSLEQRPDYFYSYGIVHSLLTYPLARVFGATFLVHRVIACTCLALACGVLYWGMRVTRVPRLLAFCGALLLFDHLVFSFAITAKPDSVGLLFLLLSVVIPLARDFRWEGVALGIVCSLLGLYTKPYFVVGGPLLILYLFLFRSKGVGLGAGVLFAGLLVASLAAVNVLLPTYFTDVFYDQRNVAEFSLVHLGIMLLEYAVLGWALVLVLGWRFWSGIREPGALPALAPRWNILRLSSPLLTHPRVPFVLFILSVDTVIYLGKMGPHPGADIQYIFHIILPFLIWLACQFAGEEKRFAPALVMLLALAVWSVAAFRIAPYTVRTIAHWRDQTVTWDHLEDLIGSHKDVLGARPVARILFDDGQTVYDAGQGEYCPGSFVRNPSKIVPAYEAKYHAQIDSIDSKIRHKQFGVVMLMGTSSPLYSASILPQYYRKTETFWLWITFPWPHYDYTITIWEPLP